jgi:CBS domain-containing protein
MTRESVQEIKAKDIMSRNLICVEPDEDVSSALGKMQHYDVDELPVVTKGKVLGLISYETLLKRRNFPMTTKVENVMTFPPRLNKHTPIMDIAETMLSSGFRAVPVIENETIVGIVTRKDLLNIIPSLRILREITVKEIMTVSPHTVTEHDTTDKARSIMQKVDVRVLPVVDKKQELVGVIGLKDIAGVAMQKKTGQTRGDVEGRSGPTQIDVMSVMVADPVTATEDTKIVDVVSLMNKNNISTVIVIKNNRPIGILTQYDLIELIASFKKEGRVFVQISGLAEGNTSAYELMFELIQKFVKRISKIATPKIFSIHVTEHTGGVEKASGNFTLRGRLTTEHEMFYATAIDWDLLKALSEMLTQMEKMMRKDKEKRRDAERRPKD